jgi:hypothetical protein
MMPIFRIIQFDPGAAHLLGFAKQQCQRLIAAGSKTFNKTWIVGDATVMASAAEFFGQITVKLRLISSVATFWPALLLLDDPTSGVSGFVAPIKSIALSDEVGEEIAAVNAPALAARCKTVIAKAGSTQLNFAGSREYVEWMFDNYHRLMAGLANQAYTYESSGIAADFLHDQPTDTFSPLYFYRDRDGDIAVIGRLDSAANSSAAGCAAVTGNAVSSQIEFDMEGGAYSVDVRKLIPWVLLKRKVFFGIGPEYGNATGDVDLDPDNPVYTFTMFGAGVSITLTDLGAQFASVPLANIDSFDEGDVGGVCAYTVSCINARLVTVDEQEKLRVSLTPQISVYRGDAWDGGSVEPDMYGGPPYSFAQFIDLRELVLPNNPDYVWGDINSAGRLEHQVNFTDTDDNYLTAQYISDLGAGIFGICSLIRLTNVNVGLGTAEYVDTPVHVGFKYTQDGFAFLPSSALGGYNRSGPSSGASWTVLYGYEYTATTPKADGTPAPFASAFATYDWDTLRSPPHSREAYLTPECSSSFSFPDQIRTDGGAVISGNYWKPVMLSHCPDMEITVAKIASGLPEDGLALEYKGTLIKSFSLPEDAAQTPWAYNAGPDPATLADRGMAPFKHTVTAGGSDTFDIDTAGTPIDLYNYADIPLASIAAGAFEDPAFPDTPTLGVGVVSTPYMQTTAINNSSETVTANLGFLFWPKADGINNGIAALEFYCDDLSKSALNSYYRYRESIPSGVYTAFRTSILDVRTTVASFAAPEPTFLAALNRLYSLVQPVTADPTSDFLTSVSAAFRAVFDASYVVLLNNFAGPTLLAYAVPSHTSIVANYPKPKTYFPTL